MYKTHQTGEMQTGILSHQVAVRNFIEQLKYYHLSCKQWKQKWQLVSVTALEFWTHTCRCISFLVSWPVHPWLHRYPPCSWTSELCVMGHGYGPCVAASAQEATAVTSPPVCCWLVTHTCSRQTAAPSSHSSSADNFIARELTCCHPLQTSLYTYMVY